MSLNSILATAPLTTSGYHIKANGTTLGNSLIWDNGTNVGIGNTNTSYTLDVSGTGRFTGTITSSVGNNAALFYSNSATTGYQYIDIINTSGRTQLIQESSVAGTTVTNSTAYASMFGSAYAKDVILFTNGAKRLLIDGTTGAATFSSSIQTYRLKLVDSTSSTNFTLYTGVDNVNSIGFYNETTGVYNFKIGSTGAATFSSSVTATQFNASSKYALGSSTSGTTGQIATDNTNNYFDYLGNLYFRGAAASNTLVTFTSGGNVGIGTSSPGNFSGVGFTGPFLDMAGILQVKGTSANGVAIIQLGGDTYRKATIETSIGTQDPYLAFGTSSSGSSSSGTERMRITSGGVVQISGNLEMGTTGLNGRLGIYYGLTSKVGIDMRDSDDASNAYYLFFRKSNGTGIGNIQRNGLTDSILYNTTSDYRLKEDFKEINGLDKILSIKVYDFKWKGLKDRMDGVVAHELQEIIPYAVSGEKDAVDENGNIKSQGVDYSKLVPILIKAIQEQNQTIQSLQEQINILAK